MGTGAPHLVSSPAGDAPPAQETEEELIARARGIHDRVITLGYATAYENAVDKFDAIHRMVNEYAPDRIELALTSDDVRRIAATGKLVAMIGVENAYPLGTDIGRVEEFFDRGARYMSLAHTGPSQLSDAHSGEATGEWLHDGLSEMGRHAVAEMNRLGIMIDISHPSKASIMQTLELTRAPIMASHSSARALSEAEEWGVPGRVDVADFVDHIDYMVNLIGLEHVGISSDFDGGGGVAGWDDASETFNVTLELVRRGYTEEEIEMLWSGNLLRVLDEVREVAATIQAEKG